MVSRPRRDGSSGRVRYVKSRLRNRPKSVTSRPRRRVSIPHPAIIGPTAMRRHLRLFISSPLALIIVVGVSVYGMPNRSSQAADVAATQPAAARLIRPESVKHHVDAFNQMDDGVAYAGFERLLLLRAGG